MLDVEFNEYLYSDGDTVNTVLDCNLNRIRNDFKNNCFGLAETLVAVLIESTILATIITFKNGSAFSPDGLTVKNEIDNCLDIYTHHSVVLLGEGVIDLLHSDRIIKTSEYIEMLESLNNDIVIDTEMSGSWYNEFGVPVIVTIDYLRDYKGE